MSDINKETKVLVDTVGDFYLNAEYSGKPVICKVDVNAKNSQDMQPSLKGVNHAAMIGKDKLSLSETSELDGFRKKLGKTPTH